MTTREAHVTACPYCDSPKVNKRVTKTPAWLCYSCHESFNEPVRRNYKNQNHEGHKPSSTEAVLADIQRVADELGYTPSSTEYDTMGEWSQSTVKNHFDSWRLALKELGMVPRSSGQMKIDLERLNPEDLGLSP